MFSTRNILRAILVVLAALVVTLLLFGGYYYWDRYVRLGDRSPLELNIEHLERDIRENPENPAVRVALAEAYLGEGQYKQALAQTSQVLSAYPDDEGALLISGMASIRLNQLAPALASLEKFVAARKDRPMAKTDSILGMAYYFLGESYVKLNRPADAIPALESALNINRTDADAIYQLGRAYQANGQPEAALDRYHQAARFVPDFTEAYRSMAEVYSALGRADYMAYARGMEAFTLQDYVTAQTQLEQATNALQDFAPAFLGLGLVYERLDQLNAALAAAQRAMELNPDDFATQQTLGRLESTTRNTG